MMALCDQVHVYEYIPSMRQTDLCHYHERYYDAACTLGAYHPLLYEKSLIQRINMGPESDLRRKGRVTLPGFSTIDCDIWDMKPHSLSPNWSTQANTHWPFLAEWRERCNKANGDTEAGAKFQTRPIKNVSHNPLERAHCGGFWKDFGSLDQKVEGRVSKMEQQDPFFFSALAEPCQLWRWLR